MVRNYVSVRLYTGSSSDDLSLNIQQLTQDGQLAISNPERFIADDMFEMLSGFIDINYSKGDIVNLLSHSGRYHLDLAPDIETVHHVAVFVDKDRRVYGCDYSGDEICRQVYIIDEIDDDDLVYLVPEHIVHPFEHTQLVTKCYHPYFVELIDAQQYYDEETAGYRNIRGEFGSGFRLFPMSMSKLDVSDWYKENLEIMEFIEKYSLHREDYAAILNLSDVRDAMKANAYDSLPYDEQADVNRTICKALFKYIPDDKKRLIGSDFDTMDDSMLEATADDVILWALIYAPDKAQFDAVHTALGFNDYRVGSLTDDIYMRYEGRGYILMDKTGEMKWYKDAYAINEWEQSVSDPYHGKFQLNKADTLLCLKEFHPELLVDDFPPVYVIKEWSDRYSAYKLELKKRHDEMTVYDCDDYGDPVTVCCGDWYVDGIESDEFRSDVKFPVFYGSKTFSRNECRRLLSGEEIVINDYQTKSGKITTIRGQLGESDFDSPFDVEFIRTDIDMRRRKQMEIESGVMMT